MQIAWEPGSDAIGDVTWPGFDDTAVVTDAVLAVLDAFGGFDRGPVEFVDNPSSRRGARVAFPYEGPSLTELWVTATVGLDRDRSSTELEHACSACGAERWELFGAERWDNYWDPETKTLVRRKSQRLPRSGVFVSSGEITTGIFRVEEFPAWIFCTDQVRIALEDGGFSNIAFLEMGETF
ncbi:MAG: hypothetical protein AAGE98_07385 [Actinomycetota bacterium]